MGILELRRQLLFNTPHIETAEGSMVQFDGDFSSKLKSCKVNFLPIQEGTGEPSPENIRNIIGWSDFRLYWNHSINLIPLEFPDDSFYGNFSTGNTSIASASNTKCWSIYVGKNQDIYYQREGRGHALRLAFADTHLTGRTGAIIYDAITMNNRDNQVVNSGEHPYLILASAKSSMVKDGSMDVNKVMLSLGDTEKPYQRRSSVDNVLINLPYDYLTNVMITIGKTINNSGDIISESGMAVTDFIPVSAGQVFNLKFTSTTAARTRRIYGYTLDKKASHSLASVSWCTVGEEHTVSATIPEGVSYIRVCYYNGDTNKTLMSPNKEGLVYGGYVDLIKGELVVTHYSFILEGTNHQVTQSAQINANDMAIAYSTMGNSGGLSALPIGKRNTYLYACNKYPVPYSSGQNASVEGVYCGSGSPYVRFAVSKDKLSDISSTNAIKNSINEYLSNNPCQIVYELETPIVYQLTPQQIKTFKGTNTVWADTNGDISVEYWTHK